MSTESDAAAQNSRPRRRTSLPELKLLDRSELQGIIARHIRRCATKAKQIKILEAGCGRKWPFDLGNIEYSITGVDMDQHALNYRKNERRDLDEAVLGDLREINLPEAEFDVIYSAFVLEHVDGARDVLENFVSWLKPGGLLVLTFPNRSSAYGFVTRVTPFWFHVFYKKYVEGIKNAGKPGFVPYPTFHDEIISRRSFLSFASDNHLLVVDEYGFGNVPSIVWAFMKLMRLLSFGRLASDHVNLMYVLNKHSP